MNGEYLNSNFVLGVGTKKGEQILARRDVNMEYGMPSTTLSVLHIATCLNLILTLWGQI